jgi:hypothetical protein
VENEQKDFSTQQDKKKKDTRISRADEFARWKKSAEQKTRKK